MLSVVIPTFGREQVLLDTISHLLRLSPGVDEILVIDQTREHQTATETQLHQWNIDGNIRLVRLPDPSIVNAMNQGLQQAKSDLVLFLDDDITPCSGLIAQHCQAHAEHLDAWAVVGQVLQPWNQGPAPIENPVGRRNMGLTEGFGFQFHSNRASFASDVIACNLSVKRTKALEIEGFDGNYIGVAYRFESDFARRIWQAGGKICYEPKASIRHLRAPSGGTRAYGHHLTSASPMHGVGDYYFALRHGHGWEKWWYILRRPFREVRTKFHLKHPWFIPVKFLGELRAMALAFKLYRQGPKLL